MKCLCSIVTVAGRLRTRFEGKISDSHIQNFNMTVVIVIFYVPAKDQSMVTVTI